MSQKRTFTTGNFSPLEYIIAAMIKATRAVRCIEQFTEGDHIQAGPLDLTIKTEITSEEFKARLERHDLMTSDHAPEWKYYDVSVLDCEEAGAESMRKAQVVATPDEVPIGEECVAGPQRYEFRVTAEITDAQYSAALEVAGYKDKQAPIGYYYYALEPIKEAIN